MATTLEAPPVEPKITDQEADQLESPKTLKEWQKLLAVYPKNSIKLMCRLRAGAGTAWTPGHILIDVYGDSAIVQPPKHGHTEKMPLSSIKLWKKGMAEAHRHLKVGPGTGIRTPRGGGAEAFTDPSRIVVYCTITNGFLGGAQGDQNLRMPLKLAAPFASKDSAGNSVGRYFRMHPRQQATLKSSLEYMTKAVAMARFRDTDEPASGAEKQTAEPQPIEPPSAVVAPPPAPEPPPAPAVAVVPPAPAPAPATCADCFNAYAKIMTDEAEAEAFLLQIRGERIRAWARVQLDQERRKLGLA